MRIHCLQHVAFEGLACIGRWAGSRGHSVTGTALYAGEALPEISTFDCLIIMGGPMSVGDDSLYSWLTPEKRFIEQAVRSEKQVLGICLGAQLLARVLGARVSRNEEKEIGWHPVFKTRDAGASSVGRIFPRIFHAFHWHGDTFDLPFGAVHLTRSEACRNQAFAYGENVIGLQFHLESTRESIDLLIENCGNELVPAPYIQAEKEIRLQSERIESSNAIMKSLLEYIENCHRAGTASG